MPNTKKMFSKKRKKSRKRGGADDMQLNRENCKNYWLDWLNNIRDRNKKEAFCDFDAKDTNYPGLMSKKMYNKIPTDKVTKRPVNLTKKFNDWKASSLWAPKRQGLVQQFVQQPVQQPVQLVQQPVQQPDSRVY